MGDLRKICKAVYLKSVSHEKPIDTANDVGGEAQPPGGDDSRKAIIKFL